MDAVVEKILNVLLETEDFLSSRKIAHKINMSESSVKHAIKEVRRVVSETGATLISISGRGIFLECDQFQKQEIRKMILSNFHWPDSFTYRKNYILKILSQFSSNYTIQLFADDLGVSRNTIIDDLEKIESWLQFYDIEMVRTRNFGVTIEGDEFNYRAALIDSNRQLMDQMNYDLERPDDLDLRISKTFYNYFQKFYSEIDLYQIQSLLYFCEKNLHTHFTDTSFIEMAEYLAILKERVLRNNQISSKNVLSKYHCSLIEFQTAQEVVLKLLPNTKHRLSGEMYCLATQFSLYGSYDRARKDPVEEKICYELAKELLSLIQASVDFNFMDQSSIIRDVADFIRKKHVTDSYQGIQSKYLIRDIKNNLSSLYGLVLTNMHMLESKLNFYVSDSDVAYITMLIDNLDEREPKVIHALLVTSFDRATYTYLKKKIEKNVPNIKIDEVIRIELFESELVDDYDLVITTVLLDDNEVLKVSRRVDEKDIHRIKIACEVIARKATHFYPLNSELYGTHLIELDFKAKSKEEVLKKGVELLEKSGCVTNAFYDVLCEREHGVSTAIGRGVAIPHGFKEEVIHSGVAIIRLKNSIDWTETEKVDIAFIFAINTDDRTELFEIFSKFYELVSNDKLLTEIKKAETVSELLSIIRYL